MTLTAGQHPEGIDRAHADMGPEQLRLHMAADHGQPVSRKRGAAYVQHAHRVAHEGAT